MAEQVAKQYRIMGKELVCPHCGNRAFYTRATLMNSPGLTFFDMDWLNKEARNYICTECRHIQWFMH